MNDLKPGHVVYAKSVFKLGDSIELGYKIKKGQYGFMTVIIGVLKDRNKRPGKKELKDRMSQIGYVTFDDVQKVLGKAAMQKVFDYAEKEYKPDA